MRIIIKNKSEIHKESAASFVSLQVTEIFQKSSSRKFAEKAFRYRQSLKFFQIAFFLQEITRKFLLSKEYKFSWLQFQLASISVSFNFSYLQFCHFFLLQDSLKSFNRFPRQTFYALANVELLWKIACSEKCLAV